MTATDELREMLNERGVEWGNIRNDGSESDYLTEWQFEGIQSYAVATEWAVGGGLSLETHRHHLTPAQAIAATLGRGECHDIGYRMDSTRFKCSQCGWDGWVRHAKDGRDYKPLWCPLCGAKVVDE